MLRSHCDPEQWAVKPLAVETMKGLVELVQGAPADLRVIVMGGDGTFNWFLMELMKLPANIVDRIVVSFFPCGMPEISKVFYYSL